MGVNGWTPHRIRFFILGKQNQAATEDKVNEDYKIYGYQQKYNAEVDSKESWPRVLGLKA